MSEIYMKLDGVSSKDVGLHVKTHRTVLPEMSESAIDVMGRDGFYDYENNNYKNRLIEVDFFVVQRNFVDFRKQIRSIALWLSQKGEIWFSDEPDKVYIGRTYDAPALDQIGSPHGRFSASFKCQPFAYGEAKSDEVISQPVVTVPIEYPGTAHSCCKLIIKNVGDNPLNTITITHIAKRR